MSHKIFRMVAVAALMSAQAASAQTAAPNYASGSSSLSVGGGIYSTPSSGVSDMEAVWHLRAALNVAALACMGAHNARTVAQYNALLARQAEMLARGNAAVDARYRRTSGRNWQAARETAMTKLYNFFAAPAAHDAFCATAESVLADMGDVSASELPSFAVRSLAAIEQPFIDLRQDRARASLNAVAMVEPSDRR